MPPVTQIWPPECGTSEGAAISQVSPWTIYPHIHLQILLTLFKSKLGELLGLRNTGTWT